MKKSWPLCYFFKVETPVTKSTLPFAALKCTYSVQYILNVLRVCCGMLSLNTENYSWQCLVWLGAVLLRKIDSALSRSFFALTQRERSVLTQLIKHVCKLFLYEVVWYFVPVYRPVTVQYILYYLLRCTYKTISLCKNSHIFLILWNFLHCGFRKGMVR